jgi:hypothetical protein
VVDPIILLDIKIAFSLLNKILSVEREILQRGNYRKTRIPTFLRVLLHLHRLDAQFIILPAALVPAFVAYSSHWYGWG